MIWSKIKELWTTVSLDLHWYFVHFVCCLIQAYAWAEILDGLWGIIPALLFPVITFTGLLWLKSKKFI